MSPLVKIPQSNGRNLASTRGGIARSKLPSRCQNLSHPKKVVQTAAVASFLGTVPDTGNVTSVSNIREQTAASHSAGPTDVKLSRDGKPRLKLSWAGAGIFFFWQLGALKYLAERYDLTRVPMVGASGGALAALMGGCGVSADLVLQRAYELSLEYGVFDRPMGLVGIWGALIEQWLDDLLPDNAADLCRDRVSIIVSTLPSMKQVAISDFVDKQDLINVAMASAHVPFVLDLKLGRTCRGQLCLDGSFPDFFSQDNSDLLKAGGEAVIFDYFEDRNLVRNGRLDLLQLKEYEEIRRIMDLGYQYAVAMHDMGRFERFDMGEIMLPSIRSIEELQ